MNLSNGSKFNFEINFIIPENNVYTEVKVVDAIAPGLTYDNTNAPATLSSTVTTAPRSDLLDVTITPATATTLETLTISLKYDTTTTTSEKNANLQPTANNNVKILIPVAVTDINALMAAQAAAQAAGTQFENVANISAYTVGGQVGDPVRADEPLNISECTMFGFGSAYDINSSPEGSKANLMFAHPAIYSEDTADLVYETVITINEALTYTGEPINIYDVNNTSLGTITNVNYDRTYNTLTLKYPHEADFSTKTIYAVVPVVSNRVLTDDDNPLLNPAITSLSRYDNTVSPPDVKEEICKSPLYEINLNVVNGIPTITGAEKSISLTLA